MASYSFKIKRGYNKNKMSKDRDNRRENQEEKHGRISGGRRVLELVVASREAIPGKGAR
jgi:hypothetical protein